MVLKKKSSNKKKYFFLLLFVLFIIIIRNEINGGKKYLEFVVLPVKKFFYTSTYKVKTNLNNLIYVKELLEQTKLLNIENYRLKLENMKLEGLQNENKRLRELLEMKKKEKLNFIVANISYRDPLSIYDGMLINKGREDGIKKDMVVLNKNVLLGKVSEVNKHTSKVDLITKEDFAVSVVTSQKKNLGIVKGQSNNILRLDYIIVDNEVKLNDEVRTSGISDIYPKGVYLGKITRIKENPKKMFKEIEIDLAFNILEIDEVIILKK